MESTLTTTIILGIGAGLFTGLGYFVKRIADDIVARIDKLEERLDARIDKLEARIDRLDARIDRLEARIDRLEAKVDDLATELRSEITELKVALTKIATTQDEHSAKLLHMMNQGERISALEGAVSGIRT